MPVAAFICPRFGAGSGMRGDPRRPKHVFDGEVTRAGVLKFSRAVDDQCILIVEATATGLATMSADPDFQLIITAANIDDALAAGQVTAIQTFLEARGIPADWLSAGETRRLALRGIAGMFQFSQRMEGLHGAGWKAKLVEHGVTLSSTWASLPTALQIELLDTAASFGWFDVAPSDATTMRQILRAMGNRFQADPVNIGDFLV